MALKNLYRLNVKKTLPILLKYGNLMDFPHTLLAGYDLDAGPARDM
jgi:hypothetical protein